MADSKQRFTRLAIANAVFTPASPIDDLALFSGRFEQLGEVLQAFNAKGVHVALYGERGVGKTSLASILADAVAARPTGTRPASVRVGCGTTDDFQSLWSTIFHKLKMEADGGVFRPELIRHHLSTLEQPTLIIIDELDRMEDDEALSSLADTIKLLSDDPTAVTLVIVGVADSIDGLVGDHKSIARALRQVHMPRMSASELEDIVRKGMTRVGLAINPDDLGRIASLAEGLPHYAHALGLYATQRAIEDDRDALNDNDIDSAIKRVVDKSQQTTLSSYQAATRSAHQDAMFEKVLLACALATKDELGMFAAREVSHPLSLITGRKYDIPAFARHLKQFSDAKRGHILQQHGSERRYFYRFDDPMMQPYVILNGIAKGIVTESQVANIKEQLIKSKNAT